MSGIWESKYPRVTDWYERIQQRPSFKQTFDPEPACPSSFQLTPAVKE